MAHIHEKVDFTVEVFIVHKNKVLLRMHDKFKIWLSVGGHIELDEDPEQAAIREVKEETGLDIELIGDKPEYGDPDYIAVTTPRFIGKHFVTDIHQHVTLVYFAKAFSFDTQESILDHEKGAEMRWLTKEDLVTMDLKNNIRFYAMKALEELGNHIES